MSQSSVVGRAQCPRCQDSGHDNLIAYDDGGQHCFSCGYHRNGSTTTHLQLEEELVTTAFDVNSCFARRGISASVVKRYQVRAFSNPEGEVCVGFPTTDKTGECSGYHYRGTSGGELTRDFWYAKGTRVKVPLFGWHLVVPSRANTIVVCEGETDTLALASALETNPSVVVVGAVGTGFAKRLSAWLAAKVKNQRVVLAFDNDRAGREATVEVVDELKRLQASFTPLKLLFEADDVSDALAAGEALASALESAQPIVSTDFKDSNVLADETVEFIRQQRAASAIRLNFSPSLDAALRISPGKLIGLLGAGGSGKSTLAEHILLETLNAPGSRALMLSAEMGAAEVALKLLSTKDAFGYITQTWQDSATEEELQELHKRVQSTCLRFGITDDFGGSSVENIQQQVLELIAAGQQPSLVVVDHFLAIASELENTSLESTAKELKELARKTNSCVVVICHIRKPPSQRGSTVYRPTLHDEYGSGGLGKWCDSVLGVALDVQQQTLLVETIKRDRMGGAYVDVRLRLVNWQLHEETTTAEAAAYDTDDYEFDT